MRRKKGEASRDKIALNPPLLPTGLPAGLSAEFFLLERDGIELSIDLGGSLRKQTLKNARLYVTTLRLCIVAPAATASGLQSIDIPLQCISGEEFKQPIFVRGFARARGALRRPARPLFAHAQPRSLCAPGRQLAGWAGGAGAWPGPGGPRALSNILLQGWVRHIPARAVSLPRHVPRDG